jgi:hypothetical protein
MGRSRRHVFTVEGPAAPVTELNREKGEYRHGWPQVLPGSRAVLFTTEQPGESWRSAMFYFPFTWTAGGCPLRESQIVPMRAGCTR